MDNFNKSKQFLQDSKRKKMIDDYLLPKDATWEQILYKTYESYRKKIAYKLGLSEYSSWEQINDVIRKLNAMEEGLDESATWDEIINNKIKHFEKIQKLLQQGYSWDKIKNIISDDKRIKQAISLGLSEDATWDKISNERRKKYAKDEARRLGLIDEINYFDILRLNKQQIKKEKAIHLGLSELATWQEIDDASLEEMRKKYVHHLGLPEDTSWKIIRYLTCSEYDRKHDIRSGELSGATLDQVNYYLEKLKNDANLEFDQNTFNLSDDIIVKCDQVERKGKAFIKSLNHLEVSIPWIP